MCLNIKENHNFDWCDQQALFWPKLWTFWFLGPYYSFTNSFLPGDPSERLCSAVQPPLCPTDGYGWEIQRHGANGHVPPRLPGSGRAASGCFWKPLPVPGRLLYIPKVLLIVLTRTSRKGSFHRPSRKWWAGRIFSTVALFTIFQNSSKTRAS